MTRSTYQQPLPADRGNAARGYRRSGAPINGGWHIYPELAAAGLWTTPSAAFGRFAIAIQNAYLGKDNSLLSKENVLVADQYHGKKEQE